VQGGELVAVVLAPSAVVEIEQLPTASAVEIAAAQNLLSIADESLD